MRNIRTRYLLLGIFFLFGFLIGCSAKSTPPGANSIGGSVDGANYSYHYWDEGLAILIWHDFSYGAEGCSGTGSTEDPVYRLECSVEAQDGRRFEWEVHSSDGQTGDMWINGESYNLSQGTLFLVSSQGDDVKVNQLQRDFSELEATNEAIAGMAQSDPDVANFVTGIDPTSE